jgi:hypothetical protein
MTPEQLNRVHLSWCTDLLQRIYQTSISNNPAMSDSEKLLAISWYAKQGLKVEREE